MLTTGEYDGSQTPPGFREEAARVVLSSSQPRKVVAADFDVSVGSLNRWIWQAPNIIGT